MMEIFQRRQELQIKNGMLLHPPMFHQHQPHPQQLEHPRGLPHRIPHIVAHPQHLQNLAAAQAAAMAHHQHHQQHQRPQQEPEKPTTSFLITDILNGSVGSSNKQKSTSNNKQLSPPLNISKEEALASPKTPGHHQPWSEDCSSSRSSSPETGAEEEEIDVGEEQPKAPKTGVKRSPLDALFKMTSKTFDGGDPARFLAGLFYKL